MNAAQLLRQKILNLAIRGKLTKREKGDEPAAALLSRIAAEKQKLTTAKKIKKAKPLPRVTDDEKPFDLPKDWAWCRLGDIGNWKAGATPSRHHSEYYQNGRIPWLKTGDLNDGYVTTIPELITKAGLESTPAVVNPVGTVLMAMYGATIGKLGILKLEAATNQACCACDLMGIVEGRYLFYYLMSRRECFRELGGGGAQPNISKDIIVRHPIPLPPIAEQKRIVSRVDELLAEVDKYSAAMDTLASSSEMMEKKVIELAIRGKLTKREEGDEPAAELLARIAAGKQKLIGAKKLRKLDTYDPISDDEIPFDELPSGWSWCRFGEVIDYVQPTEYIVRDTNYDDSYSTPVLTAGQSFVLGYTNEKDHHFKASKERPVIIFDDFTTSTQWVDFEFKVKSSAMKILVPYEGCDICMRYVFMAIRNNPFRPSTHARHWIDKYAKFVLPLPPLAEQKRIVARVDELLAECRKMRGE